MIVRKYQNGKDWDWEYPRADIKEPVQQLEEGIVFCFIEETEKPEYNPEKSYLKPVNRLDLSPNKTYPHLGTCYREWEIVDFPAETIVQRLNDTMGEHLDANYPQPVRLKHNEELQFRNPSTERIDKIMKLKEWEWRIRDEKDKRELDFINNNIFPSFEWEEKPE